MKKEPGIFVLLIALCVVVSVINPRFLGSANLQNMGRLIGMYGIFSIGSGIVIITGGIELSVGSIFALLGVVLSMMLTEWHWPSMLAVIAVIGGAMGLGTLHGFLVTKARIQPFIVTLCGLLFYRGLARFIANDEIKGFGSTGGFETLQKLATGSLFQIPMPFILLLIISVMMWVVLHRSVYGRYLYAVGRNEEAAKYSGINARLIIIAAVAEGIVKRIGRYRWVICALLFFATTINYIDRQVLGFLASELQRSIGWNEAEYGFIVTAFQAAYALSLVVVGWLMDRLGTRKGFSLAIIVWSLAAMSHALARSALGFAVARFALGLGEGGNFPAAIKTVAEWFPKKERALATGIFNAGSNLGSIVVPLTVPWIVSHYSWQSAFLATGAIGFLWLLFWLPLYQPPEEHPRLSKEEMAYIKSDPAEPATKVPWARLIPHRQTWAFAIGKFMTDPVWWFYLFWLAKFLDSNYGISLAQLSLPVVVVYLVADVGSIGGGWLSSTLIKRGWTINAGRKTAMLVCALCVVPVVFASQTSNMWVAVGLISLAAAAHQGWSANIYTMTSDMFPRRAVGSVVGMGGMAGAVGGMLFASATGYVLQRTNSNYVPIFVVCGSVYLIALLIIHRLVPHLEAANVETAAGS